MRFLYDKPQAIRTNISMVPRKLLTIRQAIPFDYLR